MLKDIIKDSLNVEDRMFASMFHWAEIPVYLEREKSEFFLIKLTSSLCSTSKRVLPISLPLCFCRK